MYIRILRLPTFTRYFDSLDLVHALFHAVVKRAVAEFRDVESVEYEVRAIRESSNFEYPLDGCLEFFQFALRPGNEHFVDY